MSYRRVGALLLAGHEDQLEQARQRIGARRAGAPEIGDVQLIDAGQARELFPPLLPGMGAVHIAGAARVDGRRLAAALVRAASRQGTTIRAGAATLTCRAGRVTGITVDGEPVEADAVVAAAGAWTAAFAAPAGVTVNVVPQRGQIVHIGLGAVAARAALGLPPDIDLAPFDPLRS